MCCTSRIHRLHYSREMVLFVMENVVRKAGCICFYQVVVVVVVVETTPRCDVIPVHPHRLLPPRTADISYSLTWKKTVKRKKERKEKGQKGWRRTVRC